MPYQLVTGNKDQFKCLRKKKEPSDEKKIIYLRAGQEENKWLYYVLTSGMEE